MQKENQSIKTIYWRKSILFLLTICLALLLCNSQIINHLSIISNSFGVESSFTNDRLATNEQIHDEGTLVGSAWSTLGTIMLPVGSVIHINCTIFAISNSSVFLEPYHEDKVDRLWDPVPSNLTLAPGESFAETYTVLVGTSSGSSEFGYYILLLITENSSATIHWWYEVHKTGKISAADLLVVTGTLILISLGVVIRSKSKVLGEKKT